MSKLRFRAAMSLDGFTAGPSQRVENPLGVGGTRLHEWAFELAVFRAELGMTGGVTNESTQIVEEQFRGVGASVMGRNMFGGHPGGWDSGWRGWWGENPPFHHPVFVLTHHPREPLRMEGGTTFHFVTDGFESALEQARRAAGGLDVSLGGGASVARHYLAAGLVDQMTISLVPIFLGAGERLFEGVGALDYLRLERTIHAPGVTHYRFVR